MSLRLSVPSSFFTVSALYRFIIGVSSENFLIAIESIISKNATEYYNFVTKKVIIVSHIF